MSTQPSFVFHGTVVALGRSPEPLIEAGPLTATVRVDTVVRAPDAMRAIAGSEITVQLRRPAAVGDTAEFSADGLLYGRSLAVTEVGKRNALPASAASERASGAAAERDRAARLRAGLKARADEASSIVVGRITGIVEASAKAGSVERLSEHDPRWATATVVVDRVIKGKKTKTVDVLFANSQDVMWYRAPKLALGQNAVMFLHKGAPGVPDKRVNAVVDPLDVQSAEQAPLVATLV